jgi:hypothetical protein
VSLEEVRDEALARDAKAFFAEWERRERAFVEWARANMEWRCGWTEQTRRGEQLDG